MNSLHIIGNVCKDPELRATQSGLQVCTFTVAVNNRKTAKAGQPEATFFRITTWKETAANCAQYVYKGMKVGVIGSVSLNTYEKNGKTYSNMEVNAVEVEFLSPKRSDADDSGLKYEPQGFTAVEPDDSLPF